MTLGDIVNELNCTIVEMRREYEKLNPYGNMFYTDDGILYIHNKEYNRDKVVELRKKYMGLKKELAELLTKDE